jgi:hypothetical protein
VVTESPHPGCRAPAAAAREVPDRVNSDERSHGSSERLHGTVVWRNGAMRRKREDGHTLRSGDVAEYRLPADHQREVGQQH